MGEAEWRTEIDASRDVALIMGARDPRDGAGTPAGLGSLYLRRAGDGTLVYRKSGVAAAAWLEIRVDGRCDVRAFGALGDGVTDDTAAVRSALAACQSGDPAFGHELFFPSGRYLITDSLRITDDRIHVRGEGLYVSTIVFRPASAAVLFDLGKPDGVLYQCSISNLSFLGDGTAHKIAIRATDTSVLTIDTVSTRLWSGGGASAPSIALQLRGREALTVRRVSFFADRPISIEDNPRSSIDLDHAHFQDLYLGVLRDGESSVVIDENVNLTNIVFDGTNAFVFGRHGILWNGPVGGVTSLNLRFSNIRCEQSRAPGGYAISMSHYVQNVLLENVHADITSNGFFLHGVRYATLLNCVYPGRGVALDIDSSDNYDVAILNCFFQAGSTVKSNAMREAMGLHKAVTGSPVAPIAFFDHGRNASPFVTRDGVRQFSHTGRLDAGGSVVVPLPLGGRAVGIAQLAARDARGGLEAGTWALSETAAVRSSGTARTADQERPDTLCLVVTSPGTARVQNNLGQAVTYVLSVDWAAAAPS